MAGDYLYWQKIHGRHSKDGAVAVGDSATVTMITAKDSNHTIYVQKVHLTLTTADGTHTWTVEDSNNTPKILNATDAAASSGSEYIWDFGPRGVALTQGKNLQMVLSGAGNVGTWEVEAYQKLTGVTGDH